MVKYESSNAKVEQPFNSCSTFVFSGAIDRCSTLMFDLHMLDLLQTCLENTPPPIQRPLPGPRSRWARRCRWCWRRWRTCRRSPGRTGTSSGGSTTNGTNKYSTTNYIHNKTNRGSGKVGEPQTMKARIIRTHDHLLGDYCVTDM